MTRVLILRTAGTNCDLETKYAFELQGAQVSLTHLNILKSSGGKLDDFQIICIPGGFSYGDDIAAGKVFANQLKFWFRDSLCKFIDTGGLILGICNGFQVLAKTGILPDGDFAQKVTLIANTSGRFEDRWTYLASKLDTKDNRARHIWLQGLPKTISLPVAHGEGKFFASKDTLDLLERNGQISFQYCDAEGNLKGYPYNPNGSFCNIAGISDTSGRIFALMPHPERHMFFEQNPCWKEGISRESEYPWGKKIFENAVKYFD